jgi:hypothetical protein
VARAERQIVKIEVELQLDVDRSALLSEFRTLPPVLRPTHYSSGEQVRSKAHRFDDTEKFSLFADKNPSGFTLHAASYSCMVLSGATPLRLHCFFKSEFTQVRDFLSHFVTCKPRFGFSCDVEERRTKNRIAKQVNAISVEAWVGRDLSRYIPGLYWQTLLTDELLQRHHVDVELLKSVAVRYQSYPKGVHLFQMYDDPRGWTDAEKQSEIKEAFPTVFDIDVVTKQAGSTTNYLELDAVLSAWK